ncbi:hypothetical protein KQX54_000437 [Cotesia glomerata]|uniref:Uncharacterized protein n=1 Tax=Cotesia glomerata TaxID=32391 RepID=A0AAV7HXY2_COTGL|nr:hypothetical protein KQX54_000437 [Cotesia glomerata]
MGEPGLLREKIGLSGVESQGNADENAHATKRTYLLNQINWAEKFNKIIKETNMPEHVANLDPKFGKNILADFQNAAVEKSKAELRLLPTFDILAISTSMD